MKIIRGIEQGTQEWHELRRGVLTASNAQAIANNGKGLETYITELMEDYYRKIPKEQFISEDMLRGIELEPFARLNYMQVTGYEVEEVAFIYYDKDKHVGCSPDGLTIDRGVELKCPKFKNHFDIAISKDNVPPKWVWQMQYSMFVYGCDIWDFGSYCTELIEKPFIRYEFRKDKVKQEAIKIGIDKGIELKLKIMEAIER